MQQKQICHMAMDWQWKNIELLKNISTLSSSKKSITMGIFDNPYSKPIPVADQCIIGMNH